MRLRLVWLLVLLAGLVALAPLGPSAAAQTAQDFPVPGGWFYTQATVRAGFGYSVVDDALAPMWTEYRRLGGPAVLGSPVSRRYYGSDGFLYQGFERYILQWRPDQQRAVYANVYEQFTDAGLDEWLLGKGIPKPEPPSSDPFYEDARRRMGWLTESRFLGFYLLNPLTQEPWDFYEQAWEVYGLPQTGPERLRIGVGSVGLWPFIVQRFQKVALQLWLDNGPAGISRGSVSIITAGTLARQASLIPITAVLPEPPPPVSPWIVGQPQLSGRPVEQLGQQLRHFALGGAGFAPAETVTVTLTKEEQAAQPGEQPTRVTWTFTTPARQDGSFILEGDALPGTYSVTARGNSSGVAVVDSLALS
ncbi:MAG: hypothetical protein HY690_01690 [Chloroflexi bacterium]|nr:hypothetical protein [Chloroflexota bacterium]